MPILMDENGNPIYLPPTQAQVEEVQEKILEAIDEVTAAMAAEKLKD